MGAPAASKYTEMAQDSPHTPTVCRNIQIALVLAALCFTAANASPAHRARPYSSVSSKLSSKPSPRKATSASAHSSKLQARRAAAKSSSAPAPHIRHQASRSKSRRALQHKSRHAGATKRSASLHRSRGSIPQPLRGSYESLVRQNDKTENDNLERIQDDEDLADRIARGMLVPVPASQKLAVNQNLPENRRYCRPWTAAFLSDLARAHSSAFRRPIFVSSAVRTVDYQKTLMATNGNAADAEGDIASPHLTGATIDLAKKGMTRQQVGWLRHWLLPLQQAGKIDVEEEFRQSCFHITVYKSYQSEATTPAPAAQPASPSVRKSGGRQNPPSPAPPPQVPPSQIPDDAPSAPTRGL